MSTAIAMAPSPAPHNRPSFGEVLSAPAHPSHATSSPSSHRSAAPQLPQLSIASNATAPRSGSGSPRGAPSAHKSSPPSATRGAGEPPRIIVKKEPGSPDLAAARHRPQKLDLSKNIHGGGPGTARGPLTAREGALGIQEVGIACLSPGFVTQDPMMQEQLQRSMSVRDRQRHIIEQRLQKSAKGEGPDTLKDGQFTAKTPGFARKRGAPPGLSIVAPSHEQFANERVIQSAPLGQTFTGRQHPHPLTRHITNQAPNPASTSHIRPAKQTNNRLPPITNIFGQGLSGHPDNAGHSMFAAQSHGPLASPHLPPPQHHSHPSQAQTPGRPREYKSAEEAQADLAGGRPELLPKIVHYGGGAHNPSSPPPSRLSDPAAAGAQSVKRRRTEYEDGASPPLGNGRPAQQSRRAGPFGEGRDSPETQRAKRDEFLRLCERAWDLFHS